MNDKSLMVGLVLLTLGVSVIVLAPRSASAQEESASGDATAAAGPSATELTILHHSGRSLTIAGVVLDTLGIGIAGIGVGLFIAAAVNDADHSVEGTFDALAMRMGAMIWLPVGLVLLAIGTPLWAVGNVRRRRARLQGYESASLRPFVAPTTGGFLAGFQLVTF